MSIKQEPTPLPKSVSDIVRERLSDKLIDLTPVERNSASDAITAALKRDNPRIKRFWLRQNPNNTITLVIDVERPARAADRRVKNPEG